MSGSNILFVFSGSIACYKACEAVSRLVQNGHTVQAVATASALRFVGAPTLEGLTGRPVLSDLFENGRAMEHINLTRWADVVIVAPATAATINRYASGLAEDLAGALFLAHDRRKPFLMAPAMNPAMWSHPATLAAVDTLAGWGIRFVAVGEGRMACGETGEGRMAEPSQIVAAVEQALRPPARRLRVLVTSGGTSEPIDGVRVLTNRSTGRTGALIASHLRRFGHEVVLLRARSAALAGVGGREVLFETFAELDAALTELLGAESFDAVIHAAAVGDFGVEAIESDGVLQPIGEAKLASDSRPLLRLKNNPKLVDALRERSRSPLTIVAFKLTRGADEAAARGAVARLFEHSGADFVVHNDLDDAVEGGVFPAIIHAADGAPVRCASRSELAAKMTDILVAARPVRIEQS